MLSTPLRRLIPKMVFPTIASTLVASLYNLADTFFVSFLGTNATGAVGVNGSIDHIIMIGGFFLASGAASFISRLLGAKDVERANRVLSSSFFSAALWGIFVMILGSVFMDKILYTLGAIDEFMPYSRQYARYVLLAAPFMATSYVLNQNLRAEGNAVYSMVGMLFGAVLNIGLDPLFIFTLDMGVAGASIATAISKFVSFSILLFPYLRRRTTVHISLRAFGISLQDWWEVIKMGNPSLLRLGMGTLAGILLNRLAGGFSGSAIAAITVTNRIVMFLSSACLGFGQGVQPIVGFSYGARRYGRITESYRFASWVATVGIALPSLLLFIFAEPFLQLFSQNDPDMVRIGAFSLRAQCVAMPFHAYCIVVNFLCVGIGRAGGAALLGLARQGVCFFPILPFLYWAFGVWGLASVQGAADVLSVALAIPVAMSALKDLRRLTAQQGEELVDI